ncbi:MAG: aminotransferase class V-fold PLP-dependent enzyme [Planctomycetota bacterium]
MPAPQPRRYLDHAATSWPKPEDVLAAWNDAARRVGATAGRATYREAAEADAIRGRAREAAARLLGGVDPRRVALPSGCTFALNTAIHGLARAGDHVIATAADHNATLRPLSWMARTGLIELTVVACDGEGRVDPAAVADAWRPATRLVVFSHVSNVTGAAQDAAALVTIAHEREALVILDASQSLGQVPFTVPAGGADVVAAPAHKWLQGTAGAALLWCRDGVEPAGLVQGGTGSASDTLEMPAAYAERLEPGTPDVPALAALAAAAAWLDDRGPAAVGSACRLLAAACAERLRALCGVRVHAVAGGAAIVSFTVDGYAPADVAGILEAAAGVQVRAGFHCAALVHEALGSRDGGTVRASFGPYNTPEDVAALCDTVAELTV